MKSDYPNLYVQFRDANSDSDVIRILEHVL